MGRITVFVRKPCRFCDVVLSLLRATIAEVEAAPESGGRRLDLDIIDCTRDLSKAQQCKALSGQFTVPQVFFNGVRVGNCNECEAFMRSGELRRRLAALALEDSLTAWPPDELAAIVKVSSELAFSAQPPPMQLRALTAAGVRSVVSLVHPAEPGVSVGAETAACAAAGLVYVHLPPHVPFPAATGIVASDFGPWTAVASPTLTAIAMRPTLRRGSGGAAGPGRPSATPGHGRPPADFFALPPASAASVVASRSSAGLALAGASQHTGGGGGGRAHPATARTGAAAAGTDVHMRPLPLDGGVFSIAASARVFGQPRHSPLTAGVAAAAVADTPPLPPCASATPPQQQPSSPAVGSGSGPHPPLLRSTTTLADAEAELAALHGADTPSPAASPAAPPAAPPADAAPPRGVAQAPPPLVAVATAPVPALPPCCIDKLERLSCRRYVAPCETVDEEDAAGADEGAVEGSPCASGASPMSRRAPRLSDFTDALADMQLRGLGGGADGSATSPGESTARDGGGAGGGRGASSARGGVVVVGGGGGLSPISMGSLCTAAPFARSPVAVAAAVAARSPVGASARLAVDAPAGVPHSGSGGGGGDLLRAADSGVDSGSSDSASDPAEVAVITRCSEPPPPASGTVAERIAPPPPPPAPGNGGGGAASAAAAVAAHPLAGAAPPHAALRAPAIGGPLQLLAPAPRRSSLVSDSGTATTTASAGSDWGLSESIGDDVRGGVRAYNDDDLDGRDPGVTIYSVEWARKVDAAIVAAPKPVLVHCRSGLAACVVVLVRAAQQRHTTAAAVHKWARALGHDLEAHPDLIAIVEDMCRTAPP